LPKRGPTRPTKVFRAQRHRGEGGVQGEEHGDAADEHHERGGELDDAGADEGAHLLDVVREAGEELPGLGLVVVAEAQPLDAREEPLAQVEGDPLRGALGEVALEEVQEPAPRRDGDEPAHGDEHHVPALLREPLVDGEPDHLRGREVRPGDEGQRERGAERVGAIALQVAEGPPDRLAAAGHAPPLPFHRHPAPDFGGGAG
jgi:hypothetical protein